MRKIKTVLLVGFGAVGQALIPLLRSHFQLPSEAITVIDRDGDLQSIARALAIQFHCVQITEQNYPEILNRFALPGSWVINLAVEVSSVDLIRWCQAHDMLYLDTCIEPWTGAYRIGDRYAPGITNYELRHGALSQRTHDLPTAVIAHGANPGLVTHFVKAALKELARAKQFNFNYSWAELAQALNVRCIQIAERDTQFCSQINLNDVFANTWSVNAFMTEAWQFAELGWGAHEMRLPEGAQQHAYGDRSAIYLNKHGADVFVKSWVPSCGELTSRLITHHEACSISHMLTIKNSDGQPLYRPTTYFAYHPSSMTQQSIDQWLRTDFSVSIKKRVLREELIGGFDELGVLLIFPGGCYWYGSTLRLEEARTIAPYNNATTMQVVAGILGALVWMQFNSNRGIVEAEDMDHELILDVARPLLGQIGGVLSEWQPMPGTQLQFDDFVVN